MSIWLLANTVGENAKRFLATDISDSAISDQSKVHAIRGGGRHLKWTSDDATAARRLAYVEPSGSLVADWCVIVDAKAHEDKQIRVVEFSTYASSETNLTTTTLSSSDFVGVASQDYVYQFSSKQSSKQGFAVEFSDTDYEKTARQIYFSEGIELADMPAGSTIKVERVSINEGAVEHGGNYYHLWGTATLPVSCVSRASLDTYLELDKREPVFFYDTSGTTQIGNAIENKLWHCIIMRHSFEPKHDDQTDITFELGILKHW